MRSDAVHNTKKEQKSQNRKQRMRLVAKEEEQENPSAKTVLFFNLKERGQSAANDADKTETTKGGKPIVKEREKVSKRGKKSEGRLGHVRRLPACAPGQQERRRDGGVQLHLTCHSRTLLTRRKS